MKEISFEIDKVYYDKFFLHIRNKTSLLNVLIDTVEYINIYQYIEVKNPIGKITICIDNMSRIFFISENKFFSISFPFKIIEVWDEYEFYMNWYFCHSWMWGNIKSIISSDNYELWDSLSFIEDINDIEENIDVDFWKIFKEILMYEDAYIRYDYDPDNHDKHLQAWTPHLHPLNHYDVFYSNKGTFKLWLIDKIEEWDFIDILNSKTDCKYIT